jgi:hypothetical protein
MSSNTYTLLNKDGDAISACYIEITHFPQAGKPGVAKYANYDGQIVNMNFIYNKETQMLEGFNRGNKFTMRPILVGGSVVGLAVTFAHMSNLTAYFAFNITDEIVYDIFAPPVHFEEMEEVEF